MQIVNIHQAKTLLSKLLSKVRDGEEIVIANRGEVFAKIIPFNHKKKRKDLIGKDKDLVTFSDDFSKPLSQDHLAEFYEE